MQTNMYEMKMRTGHMKTPVLQESGEKTKKKSAKSSQNKSDRLN